MKKTSLIEDVFGSLHKSRMRLLIPVIALVLLVGIGVFNKSSTFAWNVHEMSIQNNLDSRTDSVRIDENFPNSSATGTRTKKVTFRNTGTVASFVRMAYSESWETGSNLLTGDTGVTKNWVNNLRDWVKKDDGWYYYKKVLPANGTVDVLNSVTFTDSPEVSADYHLAFQVETVQVSDEDEVNANATETVFGRVGTVSNAEISSGAVISGDVTWS